jgi:hypothetical protein
MSKSTINIRELIGFPIKYDKKEVNFCIENDKLVIANINIPGKKDIDEVHFDMKDIVFVYTEYVESAKEEFGDVSKYYSINITKTILQSFLYGLCAYASMMYITDDMQTFWKLLPCIIPIFLAHNYFIWFDKPEKIEISIMALIEGENYGFTIRSIDGGYRLIDLLRFQSNVFAYNLDFLSANILLMKMFRHSIWMMCNISLIYVMFLIKHKDKMEEFKNIIKRGISKNE